MWESDGGEASQNFWDLQCMRERLAGQHWVSLLFLAHLSLLRAFSGLNGWLSPVLVFLELRICLILGRL